MRTVDELYQALNEDRAGFIKGLIKAGYIDVIVYLHTNNDDDLIRLALNLYNDTDSAFDRKVFESWVYRFA